MPRYFFHVHEPRFLAEDLEGTECSDQKAVTDEALQALCQIAADRPQDYEGQKLRVIVCDSHERTVLTASLSLTAAWHVDDEKHRAA
jgi:hypothetical protein